jgi:predicted esterase
MIPFAINCKLVFNRRNTSLLRQIVHQKSFSTFTKFSKILEDGLVISPASSRQVSGSLIWLHGTSHSYEYFQDLWFISLKPKHYRLVMPKAPFLETNNSFELKKFEDHETGKRKWFKKSASISDLKPPYHSSQLQEDQESLVYSMNLATQILNHETEICRPDCVVIGGSGDGAALALLCALQNPKSVGGLIMAHSYYPNFADKITIPEANKSIPVLLIHGSKNKKIPTEYFNYTFQKLKEAGMNVIDSEVDDQAGEEFSPKHLDSISIFLGTQYVPQSSQTEMKQFAREKWIKEVN